MSQRKKDTGTPNFRWSAAQSEFGIKFLATMVNEGLKVDKAFKRTAYTRCADLVNTQWGVSIGWENVYSHYKSVKGWWDTIDKARNLSGNGILFDDTTYSISMDTDTAREYIAANPSAERWINRPIPLFKEMQLICGNDRANGEFFTTSSRHFGGTQDSLVGSAFTSGIGDSQMGDASETIGDSITGEPSDASGTLPSSATKGSGSSRTKKRRFNEGQESALVEHLQQLTSTFSAFNETIKTSVLTTRPLPQHMDETKLASTVFAMASYGYSDDDLYDVCAHLIREEKEAKIFMCGLESVRHRWVRDFLRERHGSYMSRSSSYTG